MRRAVVAVALTAAGLIPLLRYHPTTSSTATAVVARSAQPPATTGSPPAADGTRTVTGAQVQSEFGPYQVQVTFSGGTITDVRLTETPSDRHSQRIAQAAAPTLRQEALQAQSARIDTVSGATATSDAYAQSLQAAIDSAG